MKVLLACLRDAHGVELVEQPHAGLLCIRKPNRLLIEVTVPYEVLEWFVDAKDDCGTFWSEWADYYRVHGEKKQQLVTEMTCDVERFVTILANSEIRVSLDQTKSKKIVELKVGGSWRGASLDWMTAGPDSVQT
ncbi:hypothetical protein [Massilia sp. PWRC2]|uniref:hypothetical protein n=1 Tax=Massilia sp. PWRC2 TaxID=2804626 RepID=UPI003CEEFE04